MVDLQTGEWARSIPGFKKAQGALFVPELNKLFLASGDDGMVRVFRGDTFELLDSIPLEPGPNRIAYEPNRNLFTSATAARMRERIMEKSESSTRVRINSWAI